jgi:alpha-mannosidase
MRNIHIISHTHWDREWYLPFQLFRLKLVRLVDGMLDILEHDRDFKYFMLDGQTIVIDDYLFMRPEKEKLLRELISQGRIIIGPWHILPDMFLVGPEAHIRNLLQGERTARKFGPKMMIGYMPDSFGHIGQIPQILRGFGMETASLWRGVEDGPTEFWWQAPDGSSVLMAYLREGYGNGADLPADNLPRFSKMIDEKADVLAPYSATSDLLIMYGTDHMEPPRNTSEAIAYSDEMLTKSHVVHSTLPNYVASLNASIKKQNTNLLTIAGELRASKRMHLLPGVLSTRMWIKQRNHTCETLLLKWVEPFSTFANQLCDDNVQPVPITIIHQPSSLIRQTWRLLMENHPHDSICGCSIDQVHEEMKVRFDQVEQVGEELTAQSLECIAANVKTHRGWYSDTSPISGNNDRSAILIFNPSSFMRTDLVAANIQLPPDIGEFDLVEENGIPLPYQQRGFGNHEIINITLDSKGLQSAFNNINEGRVAGMTVQGLNIHHLNEEVFIEAILAEGGEPNLAAWNAGQKEVVGYFSDPTITTYHVYARSTSTAQVLITVPNVPGHGYRTLWVRSRTGEEKPSTSPNPLIKMLLPLARVPLIYNLKPRKRYAQSPYKIENDLFILEAQNDSTISVHDKRTGILYKGLNRFVDGGDSGDEYNYAPPVTDKLISARLKHVSIELGPVSQTLSMELEILTPKSLSQNRQARAKEYKVIPITSTITLSNGIPRVDIRSTVTNLAHDHRLRVHFPAPFTTDFGVHDGHFEVVERIIGIPPFDETWVEQPRPEVPQLAFSSISDGKAGLTIANRGLTEVEVLKNMSGKAEIAVTLLRCVGWLSRDDFSTRKGHAGPFLETLGAQMPGTWTFDYSIISHSGDWQNAYQQAYSFEIPMRMVGTNLHPGILPASCSFIRVEPSTFIVSAIKQCENEKGWLVRGYNITGEDIQVSFRPWKSFRQALKVNLAEDKQDVLKPDKEGSFLVKVRGHEIVGISFQD